jgi:hypothetical protein
MPISYTNERMASFFKDPPMAAFKQPRNLKRNDSPEKFSVDKKGTTCTAIN